ncbi:MAG: NAD(+) synthase [Dehalococcoidales bacterium]|nr:MAG: NAD(+) synthase [Dehalococcoidales bacterium]
MDTERLAEQLVLWIREKVSGVGCKGTVLGMSGGIDSSVLAVLCQRALPQGTLGLIMPCYSNPEDEEHALAVAGKFSIATETVVLDSVFDALLKVLPGEKTNGPSSPMVQANLKARLRMLTLYYFANRHQYLVAGGSNRSELATGYFTKYGDGGVDILPMGKLVKKEVRELAAFLGIPQEIIDKPPSAGLWPGQTDEEDLGFSYDELDRYLLTGEAPDRIREKIEAMRTTADHKRVPPPSPEF